MAVLVIDPHLEERLKAGRHARGADRYDEVWEGVYVVMPIPNNEHQQIATQLATVFNLVLGLGAQGNAFAGVNLSDREDGWEYNYRVPDVAVFLSGTKAVDCRTHWRGPADLLVEITSPGDRVRDKLPFYSRLGVRELLVLTRKPWKLHFFQRHEGKLKRTQEATLDSPAAIVATVLPLTFRLVGAVPRPKIEVAHTVSTQKWLV